MCLWVFVVNGGPSYYHDTADYLNRGGQVLEAVGIRTSAPIAAANQHDLAQTAVVPEAGAGGGEKTADVSRSVAYAVLLGLAAAGDSLELIVLLNALVAMLAIGLAIRVAVRETGSRVGTGALTFAAVTLGALGGLAFYVGFLMPDIFAPVLLLVAATLAAFAGRMTRGELVLAFVLGTAATIFHNSHLLIAALLVPVVLVAALLIGGPRRWLAPAMLAVIALIGFGQLQALKLGIHKVEKAEPVYLPFLTARLVQDGPGVSYLAAHCPDASIRTCPLYTALSRSDDPARLTATHVLFERSPRLGSFRLLPEAEQRAVAQAQVGFFLAVLADRPFETVGAALHNLGRQATMNSVDMTQPDAEIRERLVGHAGLAFATFDIRLGRDDSWIPAVDAIEGLFYLAALAVVLAICVRRATPPRLRALLLTIVAGILVNDLVCGAVSQPATRYGARVIWLLPVAAAIGAGLLLKRPLRIGQRVAFAREPVGTERP